MRLAVIVGVLALSGCGDSGSDVWVGDCPVEAIILGAKEIAVYRDAGDTVLTNPSGTVGIKSSDPGCEATLQAALDELP